MCSRITGHHDSGTGGLSHLLGSVRSGEWAGITSVPVEPKTSCRATMTATAPPHTHPSALKDECTNTTIPGSTPSARKSACNDLTVAGTSVFSTILYSLIRLPLYKIFKRCGRFGQQSITFQVKAYWLNNSGMYSRVKKVRSSGSIFAIELWEIQEKEKMAPASDPTVPIHSHSSGKLESALKR